MREERRYRYCRPCGAKMPGARNSRIKSAEKRRKCKTCGGFLPFRGQFRFFDECRPCERITEKRISANGLIAAQKALSAKRAAAK